VQFWGRAKSLLQKVRERGCCKFEVGFRRGAQRIIISRVRRGTLRKSHVLKRKSPNWEVTRNREKTGEKDVKKARRPGEMPESSGRDQEGRKLRYLTKDRES